MRRAGPWLLRWLVIAALACASLPRAALGAWARFDGVEPEQLRDRSRVSLVFVDQNLSSPASMFGHTFLVFHEAQPPEPDAPTLEFLGDTNASWAELRAITNGLSGRFRLSRFALKQREYDLEDRNLHIYPVLLSAAEKERLIRLTEELLQSHHRYTFFHQNCSFHVLSLLEGSFDGGTRSSSLPFVIPSNTIRSLERRGRLGAATELQSSAARLGARYRQLDAVGREQFKALIGGARSQRPGNSRVASAVLAYVQYRAPREADASRRRDLFQGASSASEFLASESGSDDGAAKAPDVTSNPKARHPGAVGFGWRAIDGGMWTATLTPGIRAFESSSADVFKNSTLEIGRVSLYYQPRKAGLYELRLLHLDARQPISRFSGGFTRQLDVSFQKTPDTDWRLRDEYRAHFGAGLAVEQGPVSLTALGFTGPRYTTLAGDSAWSWDLGLRLSADLWLSKEFHLRSDFAWVPLAPVDHQGLWSNMMALHLGRFSIVFGAEAPAANPRSLRGLAAVFLTF